MKLLRTKEYISRFRKTRSNLLLFIFWTQSTVTPESNRLTFTSLPPIAYTPNKPTNHKSTMCVGEHFQCPGCGDFYTLVTQPCMVATSTHRCSEQSISGVTKAPCRRCRSGSRGSVSVIRQ